MSDLNLSVNNVFDTKPVLVPYIPKITTAEDVCIYVCKQLNIGTVSRHLFALRVSGKNIFLKPSHTFSERVKSFDLRIRFKVPNFNRLRKVDSRAYDYYFHQARNDVLDNKVPEINPEKCRKELVGLGITDMYRVMLDKDIPRETVESEYKKYIPKEALKTHRIFVKRPIHDTLGQLQKTSHDASFVKAEYLKQLDLIAPEYLIETYKTFIDLNGTIYEVYIKVNPHRPRKDEPRGIKYSIDPKKDSWHRICTIEELGFISIRHDGTVEISRKNGTPFYLMFQSIQEMLSFISLLDGYYRLTCKWTFNICKDVPTPSLQKLYTMKCHGPVGGEFSYAKLERKTNNRHGCFIIRESESNYNTYYIDVCIKGSSKPKTFKLEKITSEEFIFNDDLRRYKNVYQLMAAYDDPDGTIYLQECLPSSEYDESPLLLCQADNMTNDAVSDTSALSSIIPSSPLCINCKDLQVYKDRKCLKWDKNRKKVKHNGEQIRIDKFNKIKFPEQNLGDAKKYCRNPDGDLGGPWCFVEDEDTYEIEKEYCDVPFCDDPDCLVFTKDDSLYTHYTDFNFTIPNITFGIKVWDPDHFQSASARLVLSLMALPLEAKDIQDLGIGIELYISNKQSALRFGNKGSVEYEDTPNLLKSTEFTWFSLSWSSGFISFQRLGAIKSIFLQEIKIKKKLMGYKKDQFYFYAAQGTNVLWSFPFCKDDFSCDVQTTTGDHFQQFWMLEDKNDGHELRFHLRAFHSANLLFVPSPVVDYPRILLTLQDKDGQTRVKITAYDKAPAVVLKEIPLPDLLDYWKWSQLSVTFFADTMQVHWTRPTGTHLLFELRHAAFRTPRWFSPSCGDATTAHWTLFCEPPPPAGPPPALLPECALDRSEAGYRGTQNVAAGGVACLPWAGQALLPPEAVFHEKDAMPAWNYCRDPTNEKQGTFCYTISQPGRKIQKSHCELRRCKSADCKMAGTGNDYIGIVSNTRSNRTCEYWGSRTTIHQIDPQLKNDTLYADMSVDQARNFCRNPSRDMSGSWCYTTDYKVFFDVCNIRDCDKPEECTVILFGIPGPKIYILPQWKESGIHGGLHFALKQWNPDLVEGIVFEITPQQGKGLIALLIGAENNEKIILYHNTIVVKHKVLPHMVSTGSWMELWLQIRKGEILLGYRGVPDPLFEWHNEEDYDTFEPMFVSYGSLNGHQIGVFFQCDECHTEVLSTDLFTRVFPIGVWSEAGKPSYNRFNLTIRGTGTAIIRLLTLPSYFFRYHIVIDAATREIALLRIWQTPQVVHKVRFNEELIAPQRWTKYVVSFSEHQIVLVKNAKIVLNYKSNEPLLFYWFSMGVTGGSMVWSANCEPVDLDGSPRDGGWSAWSPWVCSVKCGGGEGFRTRNCSNPRPNIFGKLCEGKPTASGRCNDFECGDISPYTMELIRERLQDKRLLQSLVVDENQPIVLKNDQKMLKRIGSESPQAFYEWTLNGMFIKPEKGRITFQGDDVIIEKVKAQDAGLYVCMVHRINKKRLILRVLSLTVKSEKYDVVTRATRSVTIKCNSVILAYVYTDLSLKITLNEEVHQDYGNTVLAAVDVEKLNNVNESDSGDWQCVVEQKDLGLKWITSHVRVHVKSAPTIYTDLMEDELTAPLFSWLKTERNVLYAIIFIVVFVIVCVAVALVLYFKFCTVKRRRYVRNRREK